MPAHEETDKEASYINNVVTGQFQGLAIEEQSQQKLIAGHALDPLKIGKGISQFPVDRALIVEHQGTVSFGACLQPLQSVEVLICNQLSIYPDETRLGRLVAERESAIALIEQGVQLEAACVVGLAEEALLLCVVVTNESQNALPTEEHPIGLRVVTGGKEVVFDEVNGSERDAPIIERLEQHIGVRGIIDVDGHKDAGGHLAEETLESPGPGWCVIHVPKTVLYKAVEQVKRFPNAPVSGVVGPRNRHPDIGK